MIKLKNHCVISFGFRKGKTEHFSFQFRAISSFFFFYQFTQYKGQNKTVFTFILDRGWRESRLPSLARVLLCLVRIGVPQVSCAVRYLDKPQWRAVKDNKDRHSKVGRNFSLNII